MEKNLHNKAFKNTSDKKWVSGLLVQNYAHVGIKMITYP